MIKPAWLALLLFLSGPVAGQALEAPYPPPGELVDVGGHRVHLYCTGQGSPTVMIVGGGFSFDWGLVQPEAAKFTRVCTYDPSGTAWSDPGSAWTCPERISEVHNLLDKAGIEGPYVLVGLSIGGVVARLYASRYPNQVAGMVIVDHAFIDTRSDTPPAPKSPSPQQPYDSPPILLSQTPITWTIEDDPNFRKLPARNRVLHRWAVSLVDYVLPTVPRAAECISEAE